MGFKSTVPVVGVIGWSGSGKTVLLEKLISELVARGYRVGTVKHSMHRDIDLDSPGSDTWKHARAGSAVSVLASPGVLASYERRADDPSLQDALSRVCGVDLVLVEGYKSAGIPKILVVGEEKGSLPTSAQTELVAVLVADLSEPLSVDDRVPVLQRDQVGELADMIEREYLHSGNFA